MTAPHTSVDAAARPAAWLPVAVFAALPVVGMIAGPAYAALVFGLGAVQLLHGVATRSARLPRDRVLLGLALAFAGLAWASTSWSIVPAQSARGALQLTGVFAAALIVLDHRPEPGRAAQLLLRWAQLAFVLGAAILCLDALSGYPLQSLLSGGKANAVTKYNRGADYAVLLLWPLLAAAVARRDRPMALLLALAAALALAMGFSWTGRIAAVAGVVVLAASFVSRRAAARGLVAGTVLLAVLLPVTLRGLAEHRDRIAADFFPTEHLQISGRHRLEIWDYMTARVFERPLLGWGLSSAKAVPIRADELSRYRYADAAGIYPHNQWLQLWIETGAVGAALALALALVVLARIRRSTPPDRQPFVYAAYASALTISLANFEITTDSWWAALVACATLFAAL